MVVLNPGHSHMLLCAHSDLLSCSLNFLNTVRMERNDGQNSLETDTFVVRMIVVAFMVIMMLLGLVFLSLLTADSAHKRKLLDGSDTNDNEMGADEDNEFEESVEEIFDV